MGAYAPVTIQTSLVDASFPAIALKATSSMAAVSISMTTRSGRSSRKQPLRLPIIAPKSCLVSPSAGLDPPTPKKVSVRQHRLRFPPRSRTGCWTCRSRKVKCDEVHPQCNQCARLGHVCDYRPRLCFRDDTRRVRERMPDVRTAGNVVWDPTVTSPKTGVPPATCDLLPPFATLTSDEERERKAQAAAPGTYHVIAFPESFSRLPEYAGEASGQDTGNDALLESASGSNPPIDDNWVYGPNVIVLKSFRSARRHLYPDRRSTPQSPESDQGSFSLSAPSVAELIPDYPATSVQHMQESAEPNHFQMLLLEHFRHFVCLQLLPCAGLFNINGLDATVFEHEASNFPPLYHTIMALSALSLVRQGGGQHIDASYYYDRVAALSHDSLCNEDLLSDALYLTHFLLLVYEVVAANPGGSNLWSHHVSRLLHLALLRQSIPGAERFPCIAWWVCHVDLYALFSGAGTGDFVRAVLDNQLLLDLQSLCYAVGPSDSEYPHADNSLPLIVRLYHDTFILAIRIGLLAVGTRGVKGSYLNNYLGSQQQELREVHDVLKRLWSQQEVGYLYQNQVSLSSQSQSLLQPLAILYHTSLLFSSTSSWPGQRLESGAVADEEIHHHAMRILQIVSGIVEKGREGDRRFIAFPIFLAGAVAPTSGLKMMALELLSNLEEGEIGYNAATTCQMLQVFFERQIQHSQRGGHALEVEWAEVLAEHGRPDFH
ncbi:transcriptional regulator family: Fungal Specific TF [Aspergillus niger]|nr:transcriptional regulator family: Fungal Specific TF [Aspergillus niger]KAI2857845.1 transcriptional regulator family: Fungal Specific TF [Aspergillus niger]KAI2873609.1 transcriptional regulator family: Fungal Specific TF [Aspergillus niger]KAI2890920.1 transcriptional regulator family: Fungal Specific TF [Aspergillus niger]